MTWVNQVGTVEISFKVSGTCRYTATRVLGSLYIVSIDQKTLLVVTNVQVEPVTLLIVAISPQMTTSRVNRTKSIQFAERAPCLYDVQLQGFLSLVVHRTKP